MKKQTNKLEINSKKFTLLKYGTPMQRKQTGYSFALHGVYKHVCNTDTITCIDAE